MLFVLLALYNCNCWPRRFSHFPYTTLFRSRVPAQPGALCPAALGAADVPGIPRGAARYRNVCCRSEEHTSELQSQSNLVCRLLLEKKKTTPPHLKLLYPNLLHNLHGLPLTP